MGLKISKTILLPRVDKIKDEEVKRVFQRLLDAIQKMNQTTYGDLVGHEERLTNHGI